jgi:hypothetical protein
MRYMFLIYGREGATDTRTDEQRQQAIAAHWSVMDRAREAGVFRGAEPLYPTTTATTIRQVPGGKPVVTDGPFAETKEQLAGYYIMDCKDLDEAIGWALQLPLGCRGGEGSIEIRPIAELPPR